MDIFLPENRTSYLPEKGIFKIPLDKWKGWHSDYAGSKGSEGPECGIKEAWPGRPEAQGLVGCRLVRQCWRGSGRNPYDEMAGTVSSTRHMACRSLHKAVFQGQINDGLVR